LIKNLFI